MLPALPTRPAVREAGAGKRPDGPQAREIRLLDEANFIAPGLAAEPTRGAALSRVGHSCGACSS